MPPRECAMPWDQRQGVRVGRRTMLGPARLAVPNLHDRVQVRAWPADYRGRNRSRQSKSDANLRGGLQVTSLGYFLSCAHRPFGGGALFGTCARNELELSCGVIAIDGRDVAPCTLEPWGHLDPALRCHALGLAPANDDMVEQANVH